MYEYKYVSQLIFFYTVFINKLKNNIMEQKIIQVRSITKDRYLRDHLSKFFRSNNFNIQYINIIVKFSGDSDSNFYSLSKLTCIDLNNLSAKFSYINQVIKKFNNLGEAYESKTSINNKILILYKEIDDRG
uniref:Uncharacterized protein n=1 Tax=Fomitiporia mediterranea TaxID=208960 RepID=A0A5B9R9H4_9AGAM|nr:hypothetical protein Fomme_000088 [Fomitiporia mediterranea]QEG57098.1 hypothetical protein Fomme_000088 [Fomitiporia mediterranea]